MTAHENPVRRCLVPATQIRSEMQVSNSRFVTTVAPAFTTEEARTFIARIRAEFPDASHNVPAFLVGHASSVVAHCHDDGEPSGTAGRPVLAVLQGSGLGDIAVVVTRYFGGTKLGTGGLVRAYSDAVRQAMSILPLAEKVPTHTVQMSVPYSLFERIRLAVNAHAGHILDESFGADVTVTARLAVEQLPSFQAALHELTNGMLQAAVTGTDLATIMPLRGEDS